MGIELLALSIVSLMAGALTTLLRVLRDEGKFQPIFEQIEKNQIAVQMLKLLGIEIPKEKESYQERLGRLFAQFEDVTNESDQIVAELERHVRSKEVLVRQLHEREQDLASRIELLKESPEFVAARNQQLLEEIAILQDDLRTTSAREGRRGAIRDFVLFALGVTLPYILGWLAPRIGFRLPPLP